MKSRIVLGLAATLLLVATACKKERPASPDKDASVQITVLKSDGEPVPDIEVRVYDEIGGDELDKDAFTDPVDVTKTGKNGVAQYTVSIDKWFTENRQRQITFAVLLGDPDNYHIWSAQRPVNIGQQLSIEIRLTGLDDTPSDPELESLHITHMPDKQSYTLGESLDITGLEVTGHYTDGEEKALKITAEQITGFSSELPAREQTLTIEIDGKQTSFTIEVLPIRVESGVVTEAIGSDAYDEIVLPDNVRKIAENAFAASMFSKVTFNEGLQEIEPMAFCNASIEEVILPQSLTQLGEYAFYHCESLTRIDMSKTQITALPRNLFAYAGIEEVLWPAQLIEIGTQCFLGTARLQRAELPVTVRHIGFEAFRESGVQSVTLPNGVNEIAGRAFYLCNTLTDVSVRGEKGDTADGVIRGSCFVGCPALEHLTIPESIGTLEQNLLSQNTKVASITIPSGIHKIAFGAFDNTGIREVHVEATTPPSAELVNGQWYGFPKEVEKISVPNGTSEIYKQAEGWEQFANRIEDSAN